MPDASTDPAIRPPAAASNGGNAPARRMARAVGALMLREMATTYGRSSLGYLWAIAEPIASILLLTFVFSLMFRSPALGDNFQLFYATGILPFALWNDLSNKLGKSLTFSRQLLAYPGVLFIDSMIARALLATFTQTMIAYIIFGTILVIYDVDVTIRMEYVILAMLLAIVSGAGIGTLNAYMMVRFASYGSIYSIITRPLFIISCIFFLFETVPEPYRSWLWLNPLVHIVGIMRRGFFVTYDAEWASPAYVAFLGMSGMVLGLALLRRNASELLER